MSEYMQTLTSFAGSDLQVAFGARVIGELQQITWGIQREVAPVYTLGDSNPRSFSKGKRGIGGSLVFAVFDRDALLEELKKVWPDIAPPAMFTSAGNLFEREATDFASAISLSEWNERASDANQGYGALGALGRAELGTDGETEVFVPPGFGVIRKENILYADTLPPFDITMTFKQIA